MAVRASKLGLIPDQAVAHDSTCDKERCHWLCEAHAYGVSLTSWTSDIRWHAVKQRTWTDQPEPSEPATGAASPATLLVQ